MKKIVKLLAVMLALFTLMGCKTGESAGQDSSAEIYVTSQDDTAGDVLDDEDVSTENSVQNDETLSEEEISASEEETIKEVVSEDEEFEQAFLQMKYYEEDGVRDNALFSQFLNGEVTALSYETKENWFCEDFYKDAYEKYYHNLYGVHIFSEDMNGDGVKELLLLVLHASDSGNLYVFQEDAGALKAWEVFEDFVWMRVGNLYLHENGMIESHSGYGAGHSFYQYNESGQLELLLFNYYTSDATEGGTEYGNTLYIYENNLQVNQLDTVIFMEDNSEEMIYKVGNEEIQAEINNLVKELKESSPVVREFWQHHWED